MATEFAVTLMRAVAILDMYHILMDTKAAAQFAMAQVLQEFGEGIAVFHGSPSLAYARVGDDPRYGGVSRAFVDVPPPEPRRRAARR